MLHAASTKPGSHSHSRPQDALLYDMELPLREIFYPLGYSVEIITNHHAVLQAAHESFGHARCTRPDAALQVRIGITDCGESACPPEPTRREYNHLYSLVANVDNQALLDLRSCTSFAWLSVAAVRNRLYLRNNFLEKIVYLLLGASVVTDLHAACISRDDKGILLCGDSGAGKSTLAYACARYGWTYISDDTSYLINEATPTRVIGHSHRARFRPSARALFPELEVRELSPRLEGKPSIEVLTAELPIKHATAEATVRSIVYLKRHPSAVGKLLRLPHGTATQRACKELYSAGEIRAKHEFVLKKLADIPTYELEYSNLEEAMQLLDTLISEI
jgi:adenylate kinase family enzyme